MLVDHLQNNKERIQTFKETGYSRYISQNKLDKLCFKRDMAYGNFKDLTTMLHINSETNPPPPMINVVCKYLKQFLGASFGIATQPICCNIEYGGG